MYTYSGRALFMIFMQLLVHFADQYCAAGTLKGAVSQAQDSSAENLSLLVILSIVGHKLSALRIIFVFVDIEEEVSLSLSEMSFNVSQF